jgi:hypothetical protein
MHWKLQAPGTRTLGLAAAAGGLLLVRFSAPFARQWNGFDIRYLPSREFGKRMSNPKLHWYFIVASGPLILTFAKTPAGQECEC